MYKRDELSGYGYTTAEVELRKWTSVRPCLAASSAIYYVWDKLGVQPVQTVGGVEIVQSVCTAFNSLLVRLQW